MEWVITSAVIFAIHNSILQITCPHCCHKKLFLAMHLCSSKRNIIKLPQACAGLDLSDQAALCFVLIF